MLEGEFSDVWFSGRFDSGNIYSVEESKQQIPYTLKQYETNPEFGFLKQWHRNYYIRTKLDAQDYCQENPSRNKSWFHFAIKNNKPIVPATTGDNTINDLAVTINIVDLNKHLKLYQQGMRPVIRSSSTYQPVAELDEILFIEKGWKRLPGYIAYGNTEEYGFSISFQLKLQPQRYYYLAFCYPFSYKNSLNLVKCLLKNNQISSYTQHMQNSSSNPSTTSEGDETSDIYIKITPFCQSVENRQLNIITVSDNNINQQKQTFYDEENIIQNPFIEEFAHKKCMVITARVHPGETPGQLTFSGFLSFSLSADPRAEILRKNFVLYFIPMLNPDGVYHGHYRTDIHGDNLNRFYLTPSLSKHPQCYALKKLLEFCCDARPLQSQSLERDDVLFLDHHAHAAKRGCFLFGNALVDHNRQVQNVHYAKLTEQNSLFFDFDACNFTQKNMQVVDKRDGMAREGCSRVAFYKLFNLTYCYTLESNYNSGRWPARKLPRLPENNSPTNISNTYLSMLQDHKSRNAAPSGIYQDEKCYLEVGMALAVSVVDLFKLIPSNMTRIFSHQRVLDMTECSLPSYVRGTRQNTVSLERTRSKTKITSPKGSRPKAKVKSPTTARRRSYASRSIERIDLDNSSNKPTPRNSRSQNERHTIESRHSSKYDPNQYTHRTRKTVHPLSVSPRLPKQTLNPTKITKIPNLPTKKKLIISNHVPVLSSTSKTKVRQSASSSNISTTTKVNLGNINVGMSTKITQPHNVSALREQIDKLTIHVPISVPIKFTARKTSDC